VQYAITKCPPVRPSFTIQYCINRLNSSTAR